MARLTVRCLLALALASPAAAARWSLFPTFPWTYTRTGAATASDLVVGYQDTIWVAGTVMDGFAPTSGRDVVILFYSVTETGVAWTSTVAAKPLATALYDRAGMDEGPPQIAVAPHNFSWGNTEIEVFAAFTTTGEGQQELTVLRLLGSFAVAPSATSLSVSGYPCGAAGISVPESGTPYAVGWVTAGGVDQLFYFRQVRKNNTDFGPCVTATFWTGSVTASVTGRAIAVDGGGQAWIAAQWDRDIALFKYTPEVYQGTSAIELKAVLAPGWPRRFSTPEWDEPVAGRRDVAGNFWVVGSVDPDGAGPVGSDAAVWKFDADGNPAPGFTSPVRLSLGGQAVFYDLALDDSQNCYVTGHSGSTMVFTGYDRNGRVLPGLPIAESAGGASIEGRGIGLDSTGAAWIAATVTAAVPLSGTSYIALYRYLPTPEPAPIAPGEVRVRGPEGGVLNVVKGERMAILAWPTGSGDVRVQVRTLRGELIRELVDAGPGRQVVQLEWDGKNASGQLVASGTYAVIVTGNGVRATKRVVVVRRP